jgi:hypothetical protein
VDGRGDLEFASGLSAAILQEAPRVLGMMDRDPDSPSAGCMDRTWWAWKFTDFAGARFQEGLCYLAFLYTRRLDGSPYVGNPALLEWITLGLDAWARLQHADGSFDEAYPFERSLAATAFSSFYIAEALDMLGEALPRETAEQTRRSLQRAGQWLAENDETHGFLSNHLAAAAAALHHAHRITGDQRLEARSRYFLERILAHQSAEGWYDEYGGADPGYQTHGTFYLTRLWQLTGDEQLAASIERSMTFLAHFVHADGSVGGEYASRNTQTYYPAAFEMFASRHGSASWIAQRMRPSVLSAAAAGIRSVDVWNLFPVLNNLVFTYRAVTSGAAHAVPCEPAYGEGLVHFPLAGIARMRRPSYDAYIGMAKGGVVKVWDRRSGRLVLSDCGWLGRTHDGAIASTQYHDTHRTVRVAGSTIEVEGQLQKTSRPVMRPFRFLAFRLFSLTLGRWAAAGRWLKKQLVQVLIYRRRTLPVTFRRTIELADRKVTLRDVLIGDHEGTLTRLERGALFTTIHMGSSRYFIANELEAVAPELRASDDSWQIDAARLGKGITVERSVVLD